MMLKFGTGCSALGKKPTEKSNNVKAYAEMKDHLKGHTFVAHYTYFPGVCFHPQHHEAEWDSFLSQQGVQQSK